MKYEIPFHSLLQGLNGFEPYQAIPLSRVPLEVHACAVVLYSKSPKSVPLPVVELLHNTYYSAEQTEMH